MEDKRAITGFNDGHIAEAQDRCHIVASMIDDHLIGHPAVIVAGEAVELLIAEAQGKIVEAYQLIGNLEDA
jgi:hypothetical protein